MSKLNKTKYTQPYDTHLGSIPTGNEGYSNTTDQAAMQHALINPYMSIQHWRNTLCFQDHGDEYYDANAYAYIPTETQIISYIAAHNRQLPAEGPTYQIEPGMNNLLHGIQASVQRLLNNIRDATGTSQW